MDEGVGEEGGDGGSRRNRGMGVGEWNLMKGIYEVEEWVFYNTGRL